ncbi:hypothetical protein ACHQM5_003818 [Ranunculus cassubicifolius]
MARLIIICFILFQIFVLLATAREIKEANAPITLTRIQIDKDIIAESPNASYGESAEIKTETSEPAEGPGGEEERSKASHHHPTGEFAGGGVILGGLATAFFAAVFCYIRVTRKQDTEDDIKITTMNHKPESPGNGIIPSP